jgi:hypothetical protein
METYLSRVWIVNPATQQFSTIPPGNAYTVTAPGSITDTAVSDGGVSGQNTDSFLQKQYVNVRQSSGYLYFFGDGSVSVVSNVSTGGSPLATTYSYFNVDPQTGLSWRDSIQDFGKTIVVSNELGVFGLFGGSLTKVSDDLDNFIFENVVFPAAGGVTPSSAIATIFDIKHYLNLVTIRDPDTGLTRNVMLTWNGKKWVVASQNLSLLAISTRKVASLYQAYGSDGNSLYPMFAQPSSTLVKRLNTKQYGADEAILQKQALATWLQASDKSTTLSGVSGTLTTYVSGIATLSGTPPATLTSGLYNTYPLQPNFVSQFPAFGLWGTSMEGLGFVTMSVRFTTTSPDFTLGSFVIGYKLVHSYYGQ